MIKVTQHEAEQISCQVKHPKFAIASKRKRHGGKTYYLPPDDFYSLSILARMRGFHNKRELLIWDRRYNV